MHRLLFTVFALVLSSAVARAQALMPYTYPVAVGTTQSVAIGTNTQRKRVEFYNPNDTIKVAVCPTLSRTPSPTITCTVNGAGSITLLPYQSYRVDGVGNVPSVSSAWNAIASAPGALTIFEWE